MTTYAGLPPIVVGVENTDGGRLAIAWGADEAARRRLPLLLVHALDWPIGIDRDTKGDGYHQTWPGRFRNAGRLALDEARVQAAGRHPELTVETDLVDGEPVDVLRERAMGAAMLVLGSRHLSSVTELMTTGGIAVPVTAHAACPVVVVRASEREAGDARRIVVAVDGSRRSEAAVAYAFEEASVRGLPLLAVHVRQPLAGLMSGISIPDEMQEGRIRLAETLAGWSEKHPEVTVTRDVLVGHPVATLVQVSEHALCLVVGTRGLGGFEGMLLGSVSHGLIHRAYCPLVIVPATHDAEEPEER
ncbi:universal stress protein (plasmid) [Embleya sp. NBC_00888]|uniref:universal stress protein n=1 Tax=Embleya sp. NBC_00888 TaxID=2975960 RepID=UPI002F90BFDB|nr:universal stress protein [Embleya sp. NBC_00888]